MTEETMAVARLRRAQADAFARGHAPLPAAQLRHRQTAGGSDNPRGETGSARGAEPATAPSEVTLDIPEGSADAYTRSHLRGIALLQNQPGRRVVRHRQPLRLGKVMRRSLRSAGIERQVAIGRVVELWPRIVGERLAPHTRVEEVAEFGIVVRTDSTAWATALKYELPALMRRIDEELGAGLVQKVQILGPYQRSWNHGPRSVPGRGPRDTYG
ncbi:MAG: DciA family protein [Varibaculum sp.]|nr:DciA family protein [Varibaculum sp.]